MRYAILFALIGCLIGCNVCSFTFYEGKEVTFVHRQKQNMEKGLYNLTGRFEKVGWETELGCNMVLNIIKYERI